MADSKFLRRIFSSRVLPSWTILLLDLLIVALSVLVAYLLRFDVSYPFQHSTELLLSIGVIAAVDVVFFRVFRTYANVLRLSSFVDLLNIFLSMVLSLIVTIVINYICLFAAGRPVMPISVLVISYMIAFVLMVTFRMAIKTIYDEFSTSKSASRMNVFIYGTQAGGINIAKSIRVGGFDRFHLCGFVSDNSAMIGKTMMGVKVYPNDDQLMEVIEREKIKGIIVSPMKFHQEGLDINAFADRFLAAGVQMFTAPDIISGLDTGTPAPIKQVQIEDLLMRDPIEIDMASIGGLLQGRKILITGAAGSIGSEIMRQVASFNPYQLILVDQAETPLHDIRLELKRNWRDMDAPTIVADISNRERMEQIFSQYKPDYVFHAAAYKHVPMMEDNVSEAIQNNVLGTKVIADLSVKYGVSKFVMISTDKAVNPSNVMGCSKRICEIYVQSLARKLQQEGGAVTQFITTRFGNVLGSNGSVIPLFRKQIEDGGPVTVTHPDIIRYFMTIPEACRLVLEAGSMGHGGEIYIFDMGEPVKIVDLARKMIALSGRRDVKIEFTGLRHGEKLYEELLNTKENTQATRHDKIMIAQVREYAFDEVSKAVDNLIETSYSFDAMKTVALMKALVPEYKSLNSAYSELDK